MSHFLEVMGCVKGISNGLLPVSTFEHGTNAYLNTVSNTANFPFIGLLEPFTFTQDDINNPASTNLNIYFLLADSNDTNSEEQFNIISTCDIITNQWLESFIENVETIDIINIKKEPVKKVFDTLSGYILSIDIKVSSLFINSFPSVTTYANEISRKISPYNWQGTQES